MHLLLVLGIALLVFGPRRLPELGGALGKTIKDFKRAVNGSSEEEPTSQSPSKEEPKA